MPSRRPLVYAPIPVDHEMVRLNLLREGTTCEFMNKCGTQASAVHLGPRSVVFLCRHHKEAVDRDPRLAVATESFMDDWYNEMFNIYWINARLGGRFAAETDRIQTEHAALIKQDKRDERAAARAEIKAMNQGVRVGAPDDGLAQSRGGQSPSRGLIQPVFRNPDQYVRPVDLSGAAVPPARELLPVRLLF